MDGKTLTQKRMAIGDKTRCYRQSKRHELLSGQWEAKRMENHRKRIENIAPRIDAQTPRSATFQHVKVSQCGIFMIFLSLRFYVKSIAFLTNLKGLNLDFL